MNVEFKFYIGDHVYYVDNGRLKKDIVKIAHFGSVMSGTDPVGYYTVFAHNDSHHENTLFATKEAALKSWMENELKNFVDR